MGRAGLLLLLLVFAACAPVRVSYDYERGTDWSAYRTYAFHPGMDTGLSELDTRRLLSATEEVLRDKGYGQSEEPDFIIDIYSESYREAPSSNVGIGMGGTGRQVGGGVSVGIPLSPGGLERRITFDLVDVSKKRLIWQAHSRDSFEEDAEPVQREQRLQAVAEKVFSGFPPR